MKKKIAILGSTGSIGNTTLGIIKKDKKNFNIILLSTNSSAAKIFKQSKEFNVKSVIINDKGKYLAWKKKFIRNKINIYNNFENFNKIFKGKIDYTINAISGIDGLEPTIRIIRFTKKIAIANKESIICGWNLINKELKNYSTQFIPVDSEHFSIFKLIGNTSNTKIKKIIITASGGPFLNRKINNKIKINDALKHPNWKMGKKISIDSSTMMNKVFEVIEAQKIFNISLNKINILINPNSYLHAIIIFKNGIIKLLVHETKMDIPIFNSIYDENTKKTFNTKDLNLEKINQLNLSNVNLSKFKTLKILKLIPKKHTLFETILITLNDELVRMFLNNQIEYNKITFYLMKIINFKIFKKYCNVEPNSIEQIFKVRNIVKNITISYVKKNKQI